MSLLSPRLALMCRKQLNLNSPVGQLYSLFLLSAAWGESGRRAYKKNMLHGLKIWLGLIS